MLCRRLTPVHHTNIKQQKHFTVPVKNFSVTSTYTLDLQAHGSHLGNVYTSMFACGGLVQTLKLLHSQILYARAIHITEYVVSVQHTQIKCKLCRTPSKLTGLIQMVKIPEDPRTLHDILSNIKLCNSSLVTSHCEGSSWPRVFCPSVLQCQLCGSDLSQAFRVQGSDGRSYLLTRVDILPVTARMKRCTSQNCVARHSHCTWKEGIQT